MSSLWRNRDFALLSVGQMLSGLGTSVSSLAFPLVTLALTGSPLTAGVVGTVEQLVGLAVGLPGGVVVDRVDRRRLMIAADTLRLAAYAGIGVLVLTDHLHLGWILAMAVLEGVCGTAFGVAAMTAVPALVGEDRVAEAQGITEARTYVVQLVGPPVGGVLYGVSRALPFLADAVSYLMSVLSLLLIRRPFQGDRHPVEPPLAALVGGLRFIRDTPAIRAAVLIGGPLNLAINGTMFGVVLVLRGHGVRPELIGVAQTAVAVGGLLGAVASPWLVRHVATPTLVRVLATIGVPMVLLVWPLSSTPLAAVPVGLIVVLGPAANAGLFGHVVAVTPDQMRGRVLSALMTSIMSLTALAPIIAGALVHAGGAPALVIGFAAAYAVSTVSALTSSGIRELGA